MKENRIRKNIEFRSVYRRGKSLSNQLLVLYVYKNRREISRVGISVSKKVGKSVVRSRVKRLISESYRLNMGKVKTGYDLVFVARSASSLSTYKDVEGAVKNLLKRAGLFIDEKNTD